MELSEIQLDALRELANIGSGNAATALAGMLGRPVDLSVPLAAALSLAEAVDAVGAIEGEVTAVAIPVMGDLDGIVLLIFPVPSAQRPERIPGCGRRPRDGAVRAERDRQHPRLVVRRRAGYDDRPRARAVPAADRDRHARRDRRVGAGGSGRAVRHALLLDSDLVVEGAACEFGFLFVPYENGIVQLLTRLGLWEQAA